MRILRLISQKFKNPNPNPQFLRFSPKLNPNYSTSINPPPDKIATIANEITNLTLIEISDLTTLLSKKLEIKDIPMVSLMMPGMGFSLRGIAPGGGAGPGEKAVAAEEKVAKTAFDLKLEAGFEPGVKIKIIKELRTFTELGLKEAKELVEKAPAVLKMGVSKEDAEKIVEKMKAIGAVVVME